VCGRHYVRQRVTEGWFDDRYLVLFDAHEVEQATRAYLAGGELPGYTVAGLDFWVDLIVRDESGAAFSIPLVPLDLASGTSFSVPEPSVLKPDSRFTGKVKWYITPLIFGGDSRDNSNITWVSHDQHRQSVAWWNAKYREIKGSDNSA
jgi:hypothetical protein